MVYLESAVHGLRSVPRARLRRQRVQRRGEGVRARRRRGGRRHLQQRAPQLQVAPLEGEPAAARAPELYHGPRLAALAPLTCLAAHWQRPRAHAHFIPAIDGELNRQKRTLNISLKVKFF